MDVESIGNSMYNICTYNNTICAVSVSTSRPTPTLLSSPLSLSCLLSSPTSLRLRN